MTIEELEKWAFTNGHPDQWWISIEEGDISGPMTLSAVRKLAKKYTQIAIMNDTDRESENPVWATLAPDAEAVKAAEKEKADKEQAKVNKGCGIMIFIALLFILWAVAGAPGCPKGGGGSEPRINGIPKHQDAYYSAQTIIERRLKSPRSAKWPSHRDVKIWDMANGWVAINGNVDADNAFGASMRTPFMVTLSKTADGWRAQTLILDGETLIE